jgi:Tol biopolymer transport system component
MTRRRLVTILVSTMTCTLSARAVAQSSKPVVRTLMSADTGWTWEMAEPVSGRFIVYGTNGGLVVQNRQTGKSSRISVPVLGGPSISASGRRVVFLSKNAEEPSEFIWSVDLDTLTGAPVTPPHRVSVVAAYGPSISPDGKSIAFETVERKTPSKQPTAKLFVMPSDGGDERLLDSAGRIQSPQWTPDGKTIFYIRGQGHGPALARIPAAGGRPDSLAPASHVVGVSPDGKYVAFFPQFDGAINPVHIATLDGHEVLRVNLGLVDAPAIWSQSERSTLLAYRLLGPSPLKTVSLETGKIAPFAVSEKYSLYPRFSPDGSRLAMMSLVNDADVIVVYDMKSKARHEVPLGVQPDPWTIQWSRDGSQVAFLAVDSTDTQHDLYVADIASGRVRRLTSIGRGWRADPTLFRWRSDGKAIDFVYGATPHAETPVSLRRVTLDGTVSLVRPLPLVVQGGNSDGGYRLVDDSLVLIGTDPAPNLGGDTASLKLMNVMTGKMRFVLQHGAYWQVSLPRDLWSPDGKWIAFGSAGAPKKPQLAITSMDGSTFRLLGSPMGCDVWPIEWLPDSRSFLGFTRESCSEWRPATYIVPIDGSTPRHLPVPSNQGVTVTPDGRSLLVAAEDPKTASIVSFNLSDLLSKAGKK